MFSLTSKRTRYAHPSLTRLPNALRSLRMLYRTRAALGRLSSDQLEDIGLTPEDARREASRHIWDVPQHWRL